MSASINKLVASTFAAAAAFQERVAVLRDALPATALESASTCADALRPAVATYYGILLEVKSTGRSVFPADHADAPTARKALSRLVKAVMADVAGNEKGDAAEECEIPAELLAAAAKLAKLAHAYEGSRKLAARAVAAAFAK